MLGEAGLGKTLSTYQLAKQLISEWWQTLANPGKAIMPYFPIFIRPALSRWSYSELKNGLEKAFKSLSLQKTLINLKAIRLLVIVDGYDECEADIAPLNLAEQLGIKDLPHVKLLVTCRPNTVASNDLHQRFALNGNLMIRYFLPFNVIQLLDYLNQGLYWDATTHQRYQDKLQQSHSLRVVLRNPFVASLFVQSWETVKQKDFDQVNSWQIYQSFVEHWIHSQHLLLSPTIKQALTIQCKNNTTLERLVESFNSFASELAFNAFNKTMIFFDKQMQEKEALLSQTSQLWLGLKREIIKDSEQSFKKRQEKLIKEEQRRALLTEEDYSAIMQWRLQQFEAGSPLKNKNMSWEFSHRSFFEYFVARRIVELREKDGFYIIKEALALLNHRPIQAEPEVMVFLAEGWRENKTRKLIEPFFEILERSKKEEFGEIQASANVATILNGGRVSFSGKDLSGVRISGADLSYGVFDQTNFQKANLSRANLQNGWFRFTDFINADLTDVQFGERPYLSHEAGINSVAYSEDERWIATTCGYEVILWDASKGERSQILKGHTEPVWCVTFSPDSKNCASGSLDTTIKIWDVISGEELHTLKGHTSMVNSIVLSIDSKICISGSKDNTIKIWDVVNGRELHTLNDSGAHSIACSNGKIFASGSDDKSVRIWEIESGKAFHILNGHIDVVNSVALSADGKICISGSEDNTIKIWDVTNGRELHTLKGHTQTVRSVALSANGKICVSGSWDGTVRIWDVLSSKVLRTLYDYIQAVYCVASSGNGEICASCGYNDKTIKIWEIARGKIVQSLEGHAEQVIKVSLSSDGKICASISADKNLRIWEIKSGKVLHILKGHTDSLGYTEILSDVLLSSDGSICVSGSENGTIKIWEVESGEELRVFRGHTRTVSSIVLSADGKICISGSKDNTIKIWDVVNGRELRTLKEHTDWITSVALSSDGKICISGSMDRTIRIWDVKSGEVLHVLKNTNYVNGVVFSPDNKFCASGNGGELFEEDDNSVKIWDIGSGNCLTILSGYLSKVNSVDWKGNILITGSEDHSIKCWKVERQSNNHLSCTLLWSTEVSLFAEGCQLDRALISPLTTQLLRQKGAIGYPLISANEHPDWNNLQLVVANNNKEQLHQLLHVQPILLDSQTNEDNTLLHIAVLYHAIDVIEYLISQGANVWIHNAKGQCPGNLAADLRQKDLLAYLPCEDNENPEQTPLHLAIENGYEKVVTYLLTQRALGKFECDINAPNHQNQTPLSLAAARGNKQMIILLLEEGAEINKKNTNGQTAAHLAAYNNQIEILKLLKAQGADLLARDNLDNTLLHFAVVTNEVENLEWLLEQGIPIDLQNEIQLTPLALVLLAKERLPKEKQEIFEFLLRKGANPHIRLQGGNTVLHLAAKVGHRNSVQELLNTTKIDIEVKNDNGETATHVAAYSNQVEILELLKARGADLLAKDTFSPGGTPLHRAAATDAIKAVKWLLEQEGMPIDVLRDDGCTPLHRAAFKGQKEIVAFLLEKGANPLAVTQVGKTPINLARDNNQAEIAKLIEQYIRHVRPSLPLDENSEEKLVILTTELAVLESTEVQYGKEHPQTGMVLESLSHIYSELGDYDKARDLLIRVLTIKEKYHDREHPEIGLTLSYLGATYVNLEDIQNAHNYQKRAYGILLKFYGPKHRYTQYSAQQLQKLLNLIKVYEYLQLGNLAIDKNDLKEAMHYYELAIKLNSKLQFAQHNLGCYYFAQAILEKDAAYSIKAEKYFQEALQLGHHSGICTEYANFLFFHHRYQEVIPLLIEAIQLKKDDKWLHYGPIERDSMPEELKVEVKAHGPVKVRAVIFAYYLLILAYQKVDKVKEAMELLPLYAKEVSIEEANPLNYSLLGYAYKALQLFNEAAGCFDDAYQLKNDYLLAKQNRHECLRLAEKTALEQLSQMKEVVEAQSAALERKDKGLNIALLEKTEEKIESQPKELKSPLVFSSIDIMNNNRSAITSEKTALLSQVQNQERSEQEDSRCCHECRIV